MKRNTIQRALVLKTVRTLRCHPTADEVFSAVVAGFPTISRGTVYRNLKQLSESGEIQTVEVPGGITHFDHCCERHHHVLCLRCGKVFDVDAHYILGLEKRIRDSRGFTILGYDLTFKGVCPDCIRSSQKMRTRATESSETPNQETRP
ncbi:MAG: transcriptional repressor [Deltaproteobacteria bacterium]|nr:transcriptional repressor [Deltaproteobacteria bacterium]